MAFGTTGARSLYFVAAEWPEFGPPFTRGQFFTFMTDRQVPPTNNGAERALRPSVVFRKVTNGFRSLWGADVHALTRSVIGTARLNGIAAYQAIENALRGTVSFLS